MDPDSAASEAVKPAEGDRRSKERDKRAQTMGERRMSILEILMHTGREEEMEERGAWCIMGSPPAVYAYSSTARGWFKLSLSQP